MPYKINWKNHGIVTQWSGNADSKELLNWQKEMQSNLFFEDLRYSIHDYSACRNIIHDSDDMDAVSAFDSAGAVTNPNIKIGIVSNQPVILEMLSNYKRLELAPYEIKVFSEYEDAKKWIVSLGYEL